jgi:hypothetical protein
MIAVEKQKDLMEDIIGYYKKVLGHSAINSLRDYLNFDSFIY